jgi:branched-chain amino acid transport system substrate-binding protein
MLIKSAILSLFSFTLFFSGAACAQDRPLKIGVIADMSGMYSDMTGSGSVAAVRFAVEDFGGSFDNKPIEVVTADHLNKPDLASSIARRWYGDDGVDVIVNVAGSGPALAVAAVARAANKAALITGAVTDRLSNDACSPNHVHYGIDSHALVVGTVETLLARGKKTWFFIALDAEFGRTFLREATAYIDAHGGTVVGSAKHPLHTPDLSGPRSLR